MFTNSPQLPETLTYEAFVNYIDALPEESPVFLNLQPSIADLQKVQNYENLIENLQKLKGSGESGEQVSWLSLTGTRVQKWLSTMEDQQVPLRDEKNIEDPLFRMIEREALVALGIQKQIKADFADVMLMVEQEGKGTLKTKLLARSLFDNIVPDKWKKYRIVKLSVNEWISDFNARVSQLNQILNQKDYRQEGLWMGGLMFPEAFMTSTRQSVAQSQSMSLDDLELSIKLYEGEKVPQNGFRLRGLVIEGAQFKDQKIQASDAIQNKLEDLVLSWEKAQKNLEETETDIQVPLYLNSSRQNLICSSRLKVSGVSKSDLYQKGVAIISWNL